MYITYVCIIVSPQPRSDNENITHTFAPQWGKMQSERFSCHGFKVIGSSQRSLVQQGSAMALC